MTSSRRLDAGIAVAGIPPPKPDAEKGVKAEQTLEPQSDKHPFLFRFAEPQRAKLAAMADEVTFEKDDIVLVAGEHSTHFYLLVSGSVGVDVVARYYSARIQTIGPGGVFGWSSLLDGCDTFFQIRARERCSVLRLEGVRLTAFCREYPEFGVELLRGVLRTVADRVLAAETKLAEFCGVSTRSGPAANT
jgi:CRP-like cAMP-binding protein